jgi:hypothetical protein
VRADAAALALQMGPAAHQPALLVDQMRQLDLQAAFPRLRALSENLEDESGPVDDLDLPSALEIALLDRRQRVIDNDELRVLGLDDAAQLLNFPFAEQGAGLGGRHGYDAALTDVEADCTGKADGLRQARIVAVLFCFRLNLRGSAQDGAKHQRARGRYTGIARVPRFLAGRPSQFAWINLTQRSG